MAELPDIAKRAAGLHDAIGADLAAFGGILRCGTCSAEQPVGDVASHLRHGWPKCCGKTMKWVTRRLLDEEQAATFRAMARDAARFAASRRYVTQSSVQRRVRVGFVTARRLLRELEDAGLLGPSCNGRHPVTGSAEDFTAFTREHETREEDGS